MQRVRCYECGKTYDYGDDAFCPHCGAFNQAPRSARIGADGSVVRRDGLEERGHQGSFLHQEYHREERERKWKGLEKKTERPAMPKAERTKSKKRGGAAVDGFAIFKWIVIAFVLLQFFAGWL